MGVIPDLCLDRTVEGSFDKDIPGIPSWRTTIEQEGLRVRVRMVSYENDAEVRRTEHEGTLELWFPERRTAFVRLASGALLALLADDGSYHFDRSPDAWLARGEHHQRF